jgi:hypothetical protein
MLTLSGVVDGTMNVRLVSQKITSPPTEYILAADSILAIT